MKKIVGIFLFLGVFISQADCVEIKPYAVGAEDIINISVLQPDPLEATVTVSPDGLISFPFIGSVNVSGKTLAEIQDEITHRLEDGYMKYPVVSVTLMESRSRKFYVYGEVMKPGSYPLDENTTVLKAISIAGGFSKYGSSSRIKLLRPRQNETGYEPIRVDIRGVMEGVPEEDRILQSGDIVVISEGLF